MGTVNIILGDDGGNGNGNGGGDTPSEPYYDLCPDNNHPHMIDLCLPSGLKWACCNVGATEPFEKGGYFAWGETKGHKLVYAVNGTDSEAFKTTGPIAYEIYPNADIVTGRLDGYGAI